MASFNGNGRNEGPKRRPGDPRRNRFGKPSIESLEHRRLLEGSPWKSTTTDVFDFKNGPMANLGQDLGTVYREYYQFSQGGGQGQFTSSKSNVIMFRGNSVGVQVSGTGDF